MAHAQVHALDQTLKGYKKYFPVRDDRRPITFHLLWKICNVLAEVCKYFSLRLGSVSW